MRVKQGRKQPVAGETRRYRVQEVDGQRFIRISVDHLGLAKGEEVEALFQQIAIHITRAPRKQ